MNNQGSRLLISGAIERPLSKKYTLFRNEFCIFSKVSILLLKIQNISGNEVTKLATCVSLYNKTEIIDMRNVDLYKDYSDVPVMLLIFPKKFPDRCQNATREPR